MSGIDTSMRDSAQSQSAQSSVTYCWLPRGWTYILRMKPVNRSAAVGDVLATRMPAIG